MDLVTTFPLAALAVVIEACVGYPTWLFRAIGHPVTWIGRLVEIFELRLNRAKWSFASRRSAGFIALGATLSITACVAVLAARGLASLPWALGVVVGAGLASSLLAQRSLHAHVRAVADALDRKGLEAGREAVAKIVGRDVAALDTSGVARAAIESLAENFSDAVVAPAFFLGLFGLPGGICYKATNTADSMIGHRSPRYLAFGFAAAKLDDLANFLPARLSALLVATAAPLVPGAAPFAALRIALRDSRGHPSPNAGWPEAAFAGALGVRLGGPRVYGGRTVEDAWIGDGRTATTRDIYRALALYRRACAVHGSLLALAAVLLILRA